MKAPKPDRTESTKIHADNLFSWSFILSPVRKLFYGILKLLYLKTSIVDLLVLILLFALCSSSVTREVFASMTKPLCLILTDSSESTLKSQQQKTRLKYCVVLNSFHLKFCLKDLAESLQFIWSEDYSFVWMLFKKTFALTDTNL